MDIAVIDAINTLKNRFVPRYEVYVAKAPAGGPKRVSTAVLDPETATRRESQRLDDSVFKVTGDPARARPRISELVPLAGPWGEKRGQRTDDVISVSFSEDVSNQLMLSKVVVEVLNVYDTVRKFYRYTDIPLQLDASQTGVFPLLDYGDALAVRFGYGSDLVWVFDGMISELQVSFPAGGESRVTVTAVDRRDRLRTRKAVPRASFARMSEAQILATIASEVGLRVAAPPELATAPPAAARAASRAQPAPAPAAGEAVVAGVSGGFSASGGGLLGGLSGGGQASATVTTTGASASGAIQLSAQLNTSTTPQRAPEPHNNFKATDQDALTYITDRLKRAALELRCFGDTLFVLKPADVAATALRYVYREGLSSFNPQFAGQGKATRVRVVGRNAAAGERFEVEVGSDELREEGLIPATELLSVLEKIAAAGQAGDKVEVVTDYAAATLEETRRFALGMLKRNADETLTASGEVIGDPRIRARTTLQIVGVGRFDGFYYVTSASHKLDTSGYRTTFQVRRNSALAEQGTAAGGTPPSIRSQLVEGAASIVRLKVS